MRRAICSPSLLTALRLEHRDFNVLSSALQLLAMSEVDLTAPLGELLRDSDSDLRIQAALALGQQQHPAAIAPLVAALGDSEPNVRFHAIEALGRLRATEAIDPLADIAESGDFFLAFPAVDALARIGDPRVVPRLLKLLSSPDLERDRGRGARRAWRRGRRAAARDDAERGECRGTDCPRAREALHTLRGTLRRRRVHHRGIPGGYRTDRRADAARCGGGRRRRGPALAGAGSQLAARPGRRARADPPARSVHDSGGSDRGHRPSGGARRAATHRAVADGGRRDAPGRDRRARSPRRSSRDGGARWIARARAAT